MATVLIIGDETDPHVISVCKHLTDFKANFFIINPFNGSYGEISFNYLPFSITFSNVNKTILITKVTSIWWRLKPNIVSEDIETLNFIGREWLSCLEFLNTIPSLKWINTRDADLRLRSKTIQLKLAYDFGIKIPDTLISNSFSNVIDFIDKQKLTIYKPLSYLISHTKDRILFSSIITKKDVIQSQQSIETAPGIFQEYIEKKYELRITIINDKVFAVKINSQDSDESSIDWRKNQFKVKYEVVELESEFNDLLLLFHKSLNIVYGAYDFIVDKNGEYIFLEVNTVGQWYWLEKKLSINISKEVASSLIEQ